MQELLPALEKVPVVQLEQSDTVSWKISWVPESESDVPAAQSVHVLVPFSAAYVPAPQTAQDSLPSKPPVLLPTRHAVQLPSMWSFSGW